MKNNAAAGTTNVRGECDSEVGPVVNPHDVTVPYAFQERAEDAVKDGAMQQPWKLKKIVPKVTIASQTRKHEASFWRKLPCDVS
jgi:hypothetical protein